MIKKFKTFVSIAALFASALTAHAQLRSYVGIVREQFYPEMINFLEEYRDELTNKGYTTYSNAVDSYLKGSFGSGFVYVAENGTNYVITNRHVVSQAKTASIEFENPETGSIEKYENLSVYATDDDIDLAILKFADAKNPFKKGLQLSTKRPSDGTDVWSAGFPGLGNNPVWQLGKGSVTNSTARIKELLDPAISTLIQHSAEVDGGNSGGPLMISSAKGTAGYEVVGVNTWKATYRQNTNYSIPAKVVSDFILSVGKNTNEDETSRSRIQKFIDALNDRNGDFTTLAKYISYEAASELGKKNFEAVLKYAPSDARNTIIAVFSNSPLEGLRYAVAYQIWSKYSVKATEGTAYAVESNEKKAETYVALLKNDSADKTLKLSMKNEHGLWRVSNLIADGEEERGKKSKEKKSSVAKKDFFEVPSAFDISAGILNSLSGEDLGFSLDLDLYFAYEGLAGIGFSYEKQHYGKNSANVFGADAVLRVPMNVSDWVCINPIGKVGINGTEFEKRTMLGFFGEIGIEAMITGELFPKYALGLSYKYKTLNEHFNSSDDWYDSEELNLTFKNIKLYAKIAF